MKIGNEDGNVDSTNQGKPAVPAAPVTAAPAPTSVEALLGLVSIMAQREARLAAKEKEEQDRITARKKQYESNAHDETSNVRNNQKNCRHLKGGKNWRATQNKDYALTIHTFLDNSTRIKCTLCGMKWFPLDTTESLLRGGRKVSNHTGIGWQEAFRLLGSSTNSATSSELAPQTTQSGTMTNEAILEAAKRLVAQQ